MITELFTTLHFVITSIHFLFRESTDFLNIHFFPHRESKKRFYSKAAFFKNKTMNEKRILRIFSFCVHITLPLSSILFVICRLFIKTINKVLPTESDKNKAA